MSKSYCFAVMLAVICLSVILLSLETDAQPTIDETMTCSASTLEEVMNVVKMVASNQQENTEKIKDEIKDEMENMRTLLVSGSVQVNQTRLEDIVKQIKDEIRVLATAPIKCGCDALEPSKQALVSAFVSNCVPLLIQQNINGSNFFDRSWAEFKVGFNDSSGNYWLGNDLLSQLTLNNRYKLKFDLQSRSNTSNWYYAEYSTFRVLSETYNYELQVAGFSGNARRDAFAYQNGMMFTTRDRDNDPWPGNCAQLTNGGFWYKNCGLCSVNGARNTGGSNFYWSGLPGGHPLQSSRMWLQCN